MIDRVKIYVKAGDGGGGCNSFKGIKFTRSRHPDGGGGGKGADIIIKVDKNIQTLEHLKFKQHFRAEKGKNGEGNKKRGADGRPCIIKVPPGTVVRDLKNNLLLRDLIEPNEEVLVTKAGEGGKSNSKAKPATLGGPGEEKHLSLELKLITEVGIIGYPNAGKSTFLSKITSARPKIASYPFTTVSPFLGVLNFEDFEEPAYLTIAEIPALVKGSHEGKGLGSEFLRHAERAKILIHLIDMAAQERPDPFEDYSNLNQELRCFSPQLGKKTQILVANKMDLSGAEANLNRFSAKVKEKVYRISALDGTGIEELTNHLRSYFAKH